MAKVNMSFGKYKYDPNIIVEGGKNTRDIEFLHLSVPEGYQIDSIEFERMVNYNWYSLGVYTPDTHPDFFINNNRTYYEVYKQYQHGDIYRINNIEYSSTVKMYEVTFVNGDETKVLKVEQVVEGGSATPPPLPTDEVGRLYTGWDKPYDNIVADVTIKGVFEYTERTVTFLQTDADVESNPTFKIIPIYGTLGTLPTDPIRNGYEFKGWFTNDDVKATPNLIITEDITFHPNWKEIVPVAVGGNQVNCSAVIMGSNLIVTADEGFKFINKIHILSVSSTGSLFNQYFNPTEHPQYFSNGDSIFTLPVSEIRYEEFEVNATATIIDNIVYWTVTFKDYDGTVLKEEQVIEGQDATPPEVPIREGYVFIGWDKSYTNVTEDLVIVAQYELKKCLVKFIDNGVVVEERNVDYNDVIGSLPNELGKEGHEFIGWAVEGELINENYIVTSDLIVTAMYELATPLEGDLVNARATLYSGYIKLEADEGYDFKESVEIIAVNNLGIVFYTYFSPTDDVNDVFNDERTVAIIPIELIKKPIQGSIEYIVNAIATPIEYEEDLTTTFVNIYKVDKDLLNEIAGLRWGSNVDYGNFITSLYQLPIHIPEDKISEEKVAVQFGSHTTSVRVNTINDTKLEVDLGEITVTPIYNNVFDYRDTRCFIHLPYLEPIEIDINYVMDATLKVLLVVDLYTGYSTMNVYSDKLEGVLIRKKVELTRDIPYIRSDLNSNVVTKTGYYIKNDLTRPYIELLRGKPIDNGEGVFGRPNDIVDKIGNHTGYLEVDKVLLNTSATNAEQIEIKRLLASGVYIE